MEFTIRKGDFLRGLTRAQAIADRKSTLPILAHALLKAVGKDRLVISATDLSVAVRGSVAAKVKKPGAITVNAKMLHDVVKNLPDEEIHVSLQDNQRLHVQCGKIEYKMNGMSDRDFPKGTEPPKGVEFADIDSALLRDMIEKTIFAVCRDETRYHLSGVFLEADAERLRMVSTDGHRLAHVERPLSGGMKLKDGVIIPMKGIGEVRRLIDDAVPTNTNGADEEAPLELGLKEGTAYFRRGDVVLSVKLIDAQFPDYRQVIPKDTDRRAVVNRESFQGALRRISLLAAGDRSSGVRLDVGKGALSVSSDNPDLGEAHEEIGAELDGEAVAVGFNAQYLMDVLGATDSDEVQLELSDGQGPGVVRPVEDDGYFCVVMPIRL